MCLILKQAITPLCAPRTIPLTFKLATILLTLKLAIIPLFTLICAQDPRCVQVVVPGNTAGVLERGS